MRQRTMAIILALSVMAGSGAGLASVQVAQSIGLVEALVGRLVVRTIHRDIGRDRTIADINRVWDDVRGEIDQTRSVVDEHERLGWITPAEAARERQRLDAFATGVDDVARRERQITNYDFRNGVRNDLADTFESVVVSTTGINPHLARFAGGIIRGESPATAAIDTAMAAITGEDTTVRDPFEDLRSELGDFQEAIGALRGAEKEDILREVAGALTGLDGIEGLSPEEQEARLGTIRRAVEEGQELLGEAATVRNDLLPAGMRRDEERFNEDGKWRAAAEAIRSNSDSTIEGAILSGMASGGIARIREELDRLGVDEQDIDLDSLISAVVRQAAEAAGADQPIPPIEDLVRAAAGLPPDDGSGGVPASPDEEPDSGDDDPDEGGTEDEDGEPADAPEDTPVSSGTQGGGSAAPTAVSTKAAATVVPTAVHTSTPTVVPTPTHTPTPTNTPKPTATPTPTATTKPPTVSGSVGLSEGVSGGVIGAFGTTVNITANFAAGTVSGSIGGSGSDPEDFTCSLPNGPPLDSATVIYTSTYSTSFAGSLSAGGTFSASLSFQGNTSFVLTVPFDHPQCTHLNSGTAPGSGPWSGVGTISGTVTQDGAIMVNTSWSAGSASVAGGGSGAGSVIP